MTSKRVCPADYVQHGDKSQTNLEAGFVGLVFFFNCGVPKCSSWNMKEHFYNIRPFKISFILGRDTNNPERKGIYSCDLHIRNLLHDTTSALYHFSRTDLNILLLLQRVITRNKRPRELGSQSSEGVLL